MARSRTPPRPPLPRFAVAWFPDFPGIERIEAFRARHDPMVATIPAHLMRDVTLLAVGRAGKIDRLGTFPLYSA